MSYGGYDGGSGRKRARVSSPVKEVKMEDYYKNLIDRFTEEIAQSHETNNRDLKNKLGRLVEILEVDMVASQEIIFNVFLQSVKSRPNNIGVCSSIVAIININMYNQCGEFVDMVIKDFKRCIVKQQYTDARSLLKFMSDLVNTRVVMPSSLIQLYNSILSSTPSIHNNKLYSDWLVCSVLCGLCYSGRELNHKRSEQLTPLLHSIDQYMRTRDRKCIEVLSVWKTEDAYYADELSMWWEAIGELRRQSWEEAVVARPYLLFEDMWTKEALPHTIPPLTLPPPAPIPHHIPEDCVYLPTSHFPLPSSEFHIFEASDVPEKLPPLPAINSIERTFVNETINSVILYHSLERKICATALLSLEFRCKIPVHYLIIECMFRHMLAIGSRWDNIIISASILFELCRQQPDSVSQVLAQATVNLYDRLTFMNSHCVDRLSRWFAIHLNNFHFKWGWDDWLDVSQLPPLHPSVRFVSNTLAYCLRLSYHERVAKIVPEEMESLLPPAPTPYFKYQNKSDTAADDLSSELMKLFTNRSPVSEVSDLLNQSELGSLERVDVFMHTLLHASSRVITFTLNALNRYTEVLKELTGTDKQPEKQSDKRQESLEKQVQVLLSLHSFWKNKPQVIELLSDKLLKTGVVTWQAVVAWVFHDDMTQYLVDACTDRVLHAMLEHIYNRLSHASAVLEVAKTRRRQSRDYSGYGDEDEEDEDDDDDDDDLKLKSEDDIDREESRLNAMAQELRKAQCSVVKHMVDRLSDCLPAGGLLPSILHHRLITFLFKNSDYSCRNINYLSTSVFTADLETPILNTFNNYVSIFS